MLPTCSENGLPETAWKLASDMAMRGLPVFPLAPGSKIPLFADVDWRLSATSDVFEIARRWGGLNCNYAIKMGRNEDGDIFIGIDVDSYKGSQVESLGELPRTLTVRTARGGMHKIFKATEEFGNASGTVFGPGIDVKCESGYLVGAGSVFEGKAYEIIDSAEIAPLPTHLEQALTAHHSKRVIAKATPGTIIGDLDTPDNIAKAERYLETVRDEPKNRYMKVQRVFDYGVSPEKCAELMEEWNYDERLPLKINSALNSRQSPIGQYSHAAEALAFGQLPEPPATTTHALKQAVDYPEPLSPWETRAAVQLPRGLLPSVIEDFAFEHGETIGCDPAALAMSALAVCAAAINDDYKVQVAEHDTGWCESARLWVLNIGPPSSKKSPVISAASEPLTRIEKAHAWAFERISRHYEAQDKAKRGKAPVRQRRVLNDPTPEAVREPLKNNGKMILINDELSGWIGSMEKYSGGKGSASDRAFYLKSFDGQPHTVDRVGKGEVYIPKLSLCLLAGVQPEPIRAIAASADDGLLQRFLPVIMRPAQPSRDVKGPDVRTPYRRAVARLASLTPCKLKFSAAGQAIRRKAELQHHEWLGLETIDPRLAGHVGKYNAILARLGVVWHALEADGDQIQAGTVERVRSFLHDFLLSHAVAFYGGTLGDRPDMQLVRTTCGHILAHPELEEVTARTFARGDREMRAVPDAIAISRVCERLEAMGWLIRPENARPPILKWRVNPECHRIFAQKAKAEAERRNRIRDLIVAKG